MRLRQGGFAQLALGDVLYRAHQPRRFALGIQFGVAALQQPLHLATRQHHPVLQLVWGSRCQGRLQR